MDPKRMLFTWVMTSLLSLFAIPAQGQEEQPPIESDPPSSYDDIIALVASDLPKQERMAATWKLVRDFAEESNAPNELKIEALERFLADFPKDNRHSVFARKLIHSLSAGKSIEAGSTDYKQHSRELILRTEWFGLKGGAGIFGGTVAFTFATLRFEHFYWDVLRGQFSYGWRVLGGSGGTGFGVPIQLGRKDGRHEIRIGLGLEGGLYIFQWPLNERKTDSEWGQLVGARKEWWGIGPAIIPEFIYCARNKKGVTFTTTLQLVLHAYVDYSEHYHYETTINGVYDSGGIEYDSKEGPFIAPPQINILFGFAY